MRFFHTDPNYLFYTWRNNQKIIYCQVTPTFYRQIIWTDLASRILFKTVNLFCEKYRKNPKMFSLAISIMSYLTEKKIHIALCVGRMQFNNCFERSDENSFDLMIESRFYHSWHLRKKTYVPVYTLILLALYIYITLCNILTYKCIMYTYTYSMCRTRTRTFVCGGVLIKYRGDVKRSYDDCGSILCAIIIISL